jgi:hypothetical protein
MKSLLITPKSIQLHSRSATPLGLGNIYNFKKTFFSACSIIDMWLLQSLTKLWKLRGMFFPSQTSTKDNIKINVFAVIKKVTKRHLSNKECDKSLEIPYPILYGTIPLQ